jgi:hypothetical protein
MQENVCDTKTNDKSVETDKNVGENANEFLPFKYEQILTDWQRIGIIFKVCALCPFPKALWNE